MGGERVRCSLPPRVYHNCLSALLRPAALNGADCYA